MNIQNFSTLMSILVLVLTWLVVQPLKTEISVLTRAVDKLSAAVDKLQNDISDARVQIATIENATKDCYKHINSLDARITSIESRLGGVNHD